MIQEYSLVGLNMPFVPLSVYEWDHDLSDNPWIVYKNENELCLGWEYNVKIKANKTHVDKEPLCHVSDVLEYFLRTVLIRQRLLDYC